MSEELLINVSPMESRVAILNDGVLSELYIERHNKMGLVGNIYVGTVVRVLPGMQAAFIDIGQSRTAFLHVNDMQKIKKTVEKPTQQSVSSLESETLSYNQTSQKNTSDDRVDKSFTLKAEHNESFGEDLQSGDDSTIEIDLTNAESIASAAASNTPIKNTSTGDDLTTEQIFKERQEQQKFSGHFSDKHLKQSYQSTKAPSALSVNNDNDKNIDNRANNSSVSVMTSSTLPLTRNISSQQHESSTLVLAKIPINKLASVPAKRLFGNSIEPNKVDSQTHNTELPDVEEAVQSHKNITVSLDEVSESSKEDSQQIDQSLETTQIEVLSQIKSDSDKLDIPTFRVLPTVTEILRKDTLNPAPVSQFGSSHSHSHQHHEGHKPHEDGYTGAKTSSKRQSQLNSDELIQNRLREGQQILVQVTKDQLGTKGARLTTSISLPSRYLVYIPSADNIGISQRIDNTEERQRLRTELTNLMNKVQLTGGVIARTAAENISTQKLEEDIFYLLQLWRTIKSRQKEVYTHQSSLMVYQELSLPLRSIRDLVHEGTERVLIDEANTYEYLKQFAQEFVPMIYPRIVPYHSQQPMFDVFRVEEDLRDALKRRVDLKSGGYLIIDQTEAMTTIDVNTGSYVGGRSLEDTVYKTNLEATHAIARQLRLRNLGGIIILDFIDMQEQEHRDDVLISLQTQLAEDYARTNITQVSELGLVEMTRKRTRESLEQQLCEPCPTCQGKGFIKTAETVCFEIFREIMRCARTYNAPKQFTVVAHASVIDLLLTSEADTVADLEYLLGRVITFEVETLYTQEQYDIVLD